MERPSSGLRRGKWTQEEEAYVERVIRDFNGGLLDAAPGTTLRSYLSDKLNCDPMRITKKFTGDASIGKRVFHPREGAAAATLARARRELAAAASKKQQPHVPSSDNDDDDEDHRRHPGVHLVTADGSVNCVDVPAEQESVVASLHWCETIAALLLLEEGSSVSAFLFFFG